MDWPSRLAEEMSSPSFVYVLPLKKSPSCNLRIESSNSTVCSDLTVSKFFPSNMFLKILTASELSALVVVCCFTIDSEVICWSSIIHFIFSSSLNEVESNEFEKQIIRQEKKISAFEEQEKLKEELKKMDKNKLERESKEKIESLEYEFDNQLRKSDSTQLRVVLSQDYGIEIVDLISTVHDLN